MPRRMIAENISSGGVFLRTEKPMDLRTRVLVDFILVIGDSAAKSRKRMSLVQVGGEVIRKEKGGMAVKFDQRYSIKPFKYQEAM